MKETEKGVKMKRKMLSVFLLLAAGGMFGAQETLKVDLDAGKWHRGNNSNSVAISNADDEKILRITFMLSGDKLPEARHNFTPPADIGAYTKIKFQIRSSVTTNDGWFRLNDKGWKHQWKLWNIGSVVKGKVLPANEWVTVETPFSNLNKNAVIQAAFGYPAGKLKDGEKVVFEIRNMEFTNAGQSDENRRQNLAFDQWRRNYSPDYSDSSKYLDPPREGRIASPLPIVRDGKPCAEIIFARGIEPECVETAANELQMWIEKITGAKLPVLTYPSGADNTKLFLGKRVPKISAGPKLFADELKTLADSDGYAVRTSGREIYIFGATGKGTMNGVFAFLMNNTDLIWPRPGCTVNDLEGNEDFAVYTQKKNLDAVWGNALSRPALRAHGYQATATYKWMARNLCNYYQGGGGGDISYRNPGKRKWGNYINQFAFGHNISSLYLPPEKYFRKHPEYYSLVNGKRKQWAQLCFTNREMEKVYTENVLDMLRRAPDDTECIYISLDDTWEACECPGCVAPIKGKSGRTLTRGDENFRSTQYFLFMNRLVAAIRKEFPDMYLRTLAYFSTAPVPDCDLHEAIRPEFAPYVRPNDKRPIFSPENEYWLKRLQGWAQKSRHVDVYEYFALGMGFPRPLAEVKKFDFPVMFPYWSCLVSEYPGRWNERHKDFLKILDYSAMEYWVMAHQMWDPSRDPEALRKYFIRRTFREAAPEIEKFFGLLRVDFFRNEVSSTLGDSGVMLTQRHVIDSGLEPRLRRHLEKAAEDVRHPVSGEMIRLLCARFEELTAQARAVKTPSLAVPLIRPEGSVTFGSKVWNAAAVVNGFRKRENAKLPSRQKSMVRLFHDASNLYLYFTFFDTDMKNLRILPVPAGKNEKLSEDDHLELFLCDNTVPGAYYLFAVDPENNRGDVRNYDSNWNGRWDSSARTLPDRWEVVMKVPLSTIQCDISKNNLIRGTFIREYSPRPDGTPREYSSWDGGAHHQPNTFGSLTLMK